MRAQLSKSVIASTVDQQRLAVGRHERQQLGSIHQLDAPHDRLEETRRTRTLSSSEGCVLRVRMRHDGSPDSQARPGLGLRTHANRPVGVDVAEDLLCASPRVSASSVAAMRNESSSGKRSNTGRTEQQARPAICIEVGMCGSSRSSAR